MSKFQTGDYVLIQSDSVDRAHGYVGIVSTILGVDHPFPAIKVHVDYILSIVSFYEFELISITEDEYRALRLLEEL